MEIGEFDRLVTALYVGAAEPGGLQRALALLAALMSADRVVLALRASQGAPARILAQAGGPLELEPAPPSDRTAPPSTGEAGRGQTFEFAMTCEDRELQILAADIPVGAGEILSLRCGRDMAAGRFGDRARRDCEFLAPHLGRAIELLRQRHYERMARSAQADMLNTLCLGAMIIDHAGRILEQNFVAADILAQRDGLLVSQGVLSAYDPSAAARLRKAIAAVQAQPEITHVVQAPRQTGGPSYGLMLRAARRADEAGLGPTLAMVLIGDPLVAPAPQLDSVAKFFGFTPSEAALSVLLADGLTLDEAADQLGVSRNTARTHLRAIYQKTGVSRQSQLVRYIYASIAGLWQLEAGDEIPRRALD